MPSSSKTILYSALTLLILATGCSSVKSQKVTAENKDKIFEQIKNTKELTVEETQLLQAYIVRSSLAKGFGLEANLPMEGKTIGELIETQRKWVEETKTKEAAEKEAREKAKAAEEKQRAALLQSLVVTIYEKGFAKISYQDYITIKLSYENKSGKDIRGFKGVVVFKDLFGDEIKSVNLKEDEIFKVGETKRVSRTINYNQFIDADQKLNGTTMDNLKVEWKPELIMFTDGSTQKVDIAP